MRRGLTIAFGLAQLLIAMIALAQPAGAQNAARTLMLVNETDIYPLGLDMEVFEDPTGLLTIDQVAIPEFSQRFVAGRVNEPNFGMTRSAVWARVTLNSILSVHRDWFLVFRQAMVDRVSVHVPRPDGGWTELKGGILERRSYFRLPHRYPVFPLSLQPADQPTLYIRVENRNTLTIPLVIQSVGSLYASDRSEQLLFGTLFGTLMTVCVYLFLIWWVMRDRSQVHLILLTLSLTLHIASTSGFLAEYVTRGLPWWTSYSLPLSVILTMITGILFARDFLAADITMPAFGTVSRVLLAALAALAAVAAFDRFLANSLLPWWVIGMLAVLPIAGFGAIRRRLDGAPVFVTAFAILLVGGVVNAVVGLGLAPGNPLASSLFDIDAAVSAIILAIGVAVQFKARQEEREGALRLSNERFALAAEGASAGLYDWDLVTGTVYYSPRMAELYGGSEDDLGSSADAWTRQIHPGDQARVLRAYRAFLKSRSTTVSLEYRLLTRDGSQRWVSTTGAAVRDPLTNRVLRVAGSTADITGKKRAEESLRASESLKAAVITSSLDCIITSDATGRIIEFNPAAEQTFGHSRDAVMGKPVAEIIMPGPQRGRHAAGIRDYLDKGRRHLLGRRVEVEAMRADGGVFPVELAINEVHSGGQAVFTAFIRDITDRRRAEAALRESRSALAEKTRFLETVLDTVAQGVNVMDDDLNLMLANNRFLEMYGLPAALGTPGTPLAALFRHQIDHRPTGSGGAVEDPGKLVAEGLAHVRGTAERHLEETRPDGRVIELYRRPMEGGGLVTTYSDITRLKRAEREAKASEARFRAILEAHPVPVVITWLDDGELFYASPRTLEIFRLAGGDGNAGEAWRAADFHASAAEHERVRGHLREHGRIELMETAMRRRDGLVFPAAISARTIEFEGRMAAVMGIHDLSDSKRAEAEIERQREALVQSEKLAALGSLLAGVAHELNNPLSVVVGQSVLLEETAPDEATEIRARKIHRAADRCARIVRTFLSLARRSPPERQQVDLNEIVQAAVELVTYSLHADGVELTMDPPREPALLWGDADQLNQVVTNLVVNARQALQTAPRPRRLAIRVRLDRDDPEAPTIRLSVADNGPGVPAEIRTRIFDPFFTTKPAGIGTGVGLSMCHNIIDSHGGTVELDETPGGGATFLVTLPARRSAPADFAASTGELPAVMTPLRLLIVDDDPEIALTVAEMLAPDNHDIAIAENGAAALARLDEEPFDMVISDIRMPELDGPGLYRHLAIRHPRLLDRICFVTGDTLSEGVRDFLNETGVPVLEKPYEPADLRAMVARLVGKLGESQ